MTHTNPPLPPDGIGFYGLDEGIPAGSGSWLNVVGPNIALTRSGTVIDLTHSNPPFPADGIGVYVTDEGVPQGTGTTLNFVGAGVTASRSGTVINVSIPGGGSSPPVTGTVVGLDEGSTLGSFDRINFRGPGVTAAASGTYLDVSIPGTATPVYQTIFVERLIEAVRLTASTGTIRVVFPATGTVDMRVRLYGRSSNGSTEVSPQTYFNGINTGSAYALSSHEGGDANPNSAHRAFHGGAPNAGSVFGTGSIMYELASNEYRFPNHRWTGTVPRMYFESHGFGFHSALTGTQYYGQVHMKQAHIGIEYLDVVVATWLSGTYYEVYAYGPVTIRSA
jgi:hypothetical protein